LRRALLSQEGGAARKGLASGGSESKLCGNALGNLSSRDLDFVSITLPF